MQLLLETSQFDAWEQVIAGTLGHHHSRLLPGSTPFSAKIHTGFVDDFQILLLHGCGQVELLREQCESGVLWLPLQGWSHEFINGREFLAEQGMGLLFQPGDVMQGVTSEEVRGISILVPHQYLQGSGPSTPLLWQGAAARRLITTCMQMVEASAVDRQGASFAAEALVDGLALLCNPPLEQPGGWIRAARRKRTVDEARQWMKQHLSERLSVVEISKAVNVSVRSLQYSFQAELGCTPMMEAKRLRLHHLRQLLQDEELSQHRIADLMAASGLLACGATAVDYRHWCGETPRRTRQRFKTHRLIENPHRSGHL